MVARRVEALPPRAALYLEDVIGFVKETQPEAWRKRSKQCPKDPDKALLDAVSRQLAKADPNGTAKELRKCGTLEVLRHPIKDRGAQFRLWQSKPDHDLNDKTPERYAANRLRVVPELNYSPHSAKYSKDGAAVDLHDLKIMRLASTDEP